MKGQGGSLPSLERNRQKPSAVETIMRREEGIFLKFHIKLESSESVKEQKCVCRVSLYRSHPNYRVDWIDNSKARDRSKISSAFRNCRLILSLNSNLWSFNILFKIFYLVFFQEARVLSMPSNMLLRLYFTYSGNHNEASNSILFQY